MKISNNLLALCAFQSAVWGTSAFLAPSPNAFKGRSLIASSMLSPGAGDPSVDTMQGGPAPMDQRAEDLGARLAPLEQPQGAPQGGGPKPFKTDDTILVQGGSLKTWTFRSPSVERVQVVLKTEGRPLDADVELWQGPDNTPQKMRVYLEDGKMRPFRCFIEAPRGPNTVAIRNIGQMEFPLAASVSADDGSMDPTAVTQFSKKTTIQGGALKTWPFDPSVESVQILLVTDGRPLNARIELLQGPNNNKQVLEVYTEDGVDRPFYVILETPGSGNVVRVVNTSPMEFPMQAFVEPYKIGSYDSSLDVVIGGD